jgi:hypothetical protein
MIAVALAIRAADVPHALMDASDAANLAFTQCLFETVRDAQRSKTPADALDAKLRHACAAKAQALRPLVIQLLRARGQPSPEAAVDRQIDRTYRSLADEYRDLPRLQAQLRAYCAVRPRSCR